MVHFAALFLQLQATSSGSTPPNPASAAFGVTLVDLAGVELPGSPWFERVRAFNEGSPLKIAVDPSRNPELFRRTVDVYVVPHKDRRQWHADPSLSDVRGAPQRATFPGPDLRSNIVTLDEGSLAGVTGTTEIGRGYDIVLDADFDGRLSAGDAIDGLEEEAGFSVFGDLNQPGPHAVVEALYSAGTWLGQDLYYPADISELGTLPLVIVSHGNGHNYQWYDHIGYHLASWGYVVMSHTNNTGPGIESASQTTLDNTEYLLANLATIAGGALQGHVDAKRMVWIGHSRGGEGVVRAYDRIQDGSYAPLNFELADVRLISSIAPTDFLGSASANPHGVTYHLWTGASDSDVDGCADCDICQTFHLYERAQATRFSISIYGVGHGDFHAGTGGSFAQGPCKVGRTDTHTVMRGYLLALLKHVIEFDQAAKEFLWRPWETFHHLGASENPCIVVNLQCQEDELSGKFIVDDFQTNPELDRSSSGGWVYSDLSGIVEGRLDDANTTFSDDVTDPMNGMTACGPSDDSRGVVFDYDGSAPRYALFEVLPPGRDLRGFRYLSLRAAQATRHPLTTLELADVVFEVALIDSALHVSRLSLASYSAGVEEPYQRTTCGVGVGYYNDFETIRIPLRDFAANRPEFQLFDVIAVAFYFGPGHGSAFARLGVDEIEFTRD